MADFLKYLTPGERDKDWGIYLNVSGYSHVQPFSPYPSPAHPTGYHFNWDQGRLLNEYQINYITEGKGILETRTGKYQIKPGSVLLISPNVWHRYRPLQKTGWKEQYIGFNGTIAAQFLAHPLFSAELPVIQIGMHEEVLDTYLKIFDLAKEEKPGYQQIASGMIVKLLGYLLSFEMQKEFTGKRIATIIEESRFKMRAAINTSIDLKELADHYHIGYSYFRKMFKSYTGVAPHQYYLELKIMRAKELLLSTDKSVKEISFELGFQSIHYFSRIFKSKTGVSPSDLRS
ncbi:helix-turn-helix transcriptional regulator [Mangrovibacterium diazotrophicum]|uniref:AraC family transcriptional regulator n=1 Tax=Mangrovibacterium diazotrophicum TaxID=1261403 RepID=A0A419W3P5_9BACT|nr:AraC family transcriptional regulator [Mangrovibacterium diazotrophicum]RKD89930.1 AraC family transcriptional regulator [Mangrovibacterium diazotrophicum]